MTDDKRAPPEAAPEDALEVAPPEAALGVAPEAPLETAPEALPTSELSSVVDVPVPVPVHDSGPWADRDEQGRSRTGTGTGSGLIDAGLLDVAPEPALEVTHEEVVQGTSLGARFEGLYGRFERYMPWLSLVLSVVGAVAVDRSETRGPWVAAAAAAGWVVLVLVSLTHRPHDAATTGALRKLARFAATSASQSLLQLSLFFCAPFYFEASAWTLSQWAFGVVFVAAAALTLWDPLCSRVLLHPVGGPFLTAFANFVGWNAALPMLGVAQRTSVWISAFSVALALPITRFLQGARGRVLWGALLAGALLPTLLFAGGIRAIPPAPLRVVHAAIGTKIVERELVDPRQHFGHAPPALLCHTAIRAPIGLKDRLEHVWTLNGEELSRLPIKLQGGRQRGFRTWSRLHVSSHAEGILRCEVRNSLGQDLGGTSVMLGRVDPAQPHR